MAQNQTAETLEARVERQQQEQEQFAENARRKFQQKADAIREDCPFATSGELWMSLDIDSDGRSEVAVYDYADFQAAATLSAQDLRNLRDYLNAQDLGD